MTDEKKDITPENKEAEDKEEKAPETPEKEEKEDKEDKKSAKAEKKKEQKESERLKKELEAAKKSLEESKDKYLRMLAEYENFRKRAAKEKEGIYSDAASDVIGAVLPVLDNLERALKFSDEKEGKLYEGLNMTLKSFKEALEKIGVSEIESDGCAFDPNLHNAVMHIEDENYGESVVVETFSKGYRKGDKIIRYAMVKVAN